MPALSMHLYPNGLPGSAYWYLLMQYGCTNRSDTNHIDQTVNASSVWNVNFGGSFYGGTFTVTATYDSLKCDNFVFYVRGTNPSTAAVRTYLAATNPYFYAAAIAMVESSMREFETGGVLGPNWNTRYKSCPLRHADRTGSYGWGLFQLTNPAPPQNQPTPLWSWKANADFAKTIMNNKNSIATTWINQQVANQMRDNPNKPLSGHKFTWGGVTFQAGTSRTPIDACAIQAFNSYSPSTWVVYWNGTDWAQQNSSYVTHVCENL